MKKSLYSLMLMDDVVAEIDRLALSENTNRSNLINQILAEYVSVSTPEKEIDSIFRSVEKLLGQNGGLVPFVSPNQLSMSVKSSLEYKYKPTVKYTVQLYRVPGKSFGELTVHFRSQSASLLTAMAHFFLFWKRLEDHYISQLYDEGSIIYELGDSRFVRTLALPSGRDYRAGDLGEAISAYVSMFDELMKGYLSGKYSERELERRYVGYLNSGVGLI